MHQPMIPRENILSLDVHSTHNHDLALKWTRDMLSDVVYAFRAVGARTHAHISSHGARQATTTVAQTHEAGP